MGGILGRMDFARFRFRSDTLRATTMCRPWILDIRTVSLFFLVPGIRVSVVGRFKTTYVVVVDASARFLPHNCGQPVVCSCSSQCCMVFHFTGTCIGLPKPLTKTPLRIGKVILLLLYAV
jgi:hypothetical protein